MSSCKLRPTHPPREEWLAIRALAKLHSFTWVINDFKVDDTSYYRPAYVATFEIPNVTQRWTIEFQPPAKRHYTCPGRLSLRPDYKSLSEKLQFRAYILSAHKTQVCDTLSSCQQPTFTVYDTDSSFVWHKFVSVEDLLDQSKGLIDNNTLTIVCEARVLEGIDLNVVNKSRSERVQSIEFGVVGDSIPHQHDLVADLRALYVDGRASDVTIYAGGRKFAVHKAVLVGRSTVFHAMFNHDMEERESGTITIDDMRADVVDAMLHFMYTDEVPNIDTLATEMLVAADKYDIPRLKAECERQLTKTLDVNNATARLTFSYLHRATQLQSASVSFITRNLDEVMRTDGWMSLSTGLKEMLFVELAEVMKVMKEAKLI